ncbi:MAG: hypothetical protein RIS29_1968 [Bacteroidota bacterium]|jgi:hypothetical protein
MRYNSCLRKFAILSFFVLYCFVLSAAVPAGYYYFVKNKKKVALKTALHDNCKPLREFDYGGGAGFTWEGFYSSDRNTDNSVIDMYSDSVRHFNGFAAVSGMHIEHSFPKSWWGGHNNGAYKDLFHLYPADGVTNSTKNDLPLGEVSGTPTFFNGKTKIGKNGFGSAYTGNCFEPADEFKGDFARSYFYIATVYEELAPLMQSPMTYTTAYPFWQPWAIDLLLKWNAQDPVSDKERKRIEAVYGLQGNRNPFIDYPDLANYIWGSDSTKVYPFPEETEPFLLTPRSGNKLDMGVILLNDSRSKLLHVQAVNVTASLKLELEHRSSGLSLSKSTLTTAEALAGTDVSVVFNPQTAGFTVDTLLITGGGIADTLRLPLKALASADFITLEPTDATPVGGTLQWISDPLATQYRLKVYQGDQSAGDLIISAYVEGSSWNKAIELYNGTANTIDLSKYSLRKQSNGAGAFGSALKLTGTLASGKTYVIAHKQAASDLIAKVTMVTDSLLQFNGNDAIALIRSGVTIDMVGKADGGADYNWGLDNTLVRKNTVTHPVSVFNIVEWQAYPVDSYSMLGTHQMAFALSDPVVIKDIYLTTTTYPIDGLMPDGVYTYSVQSMRSGVIAPAVNTMQLHTTSLDIPVVMEPSDVSTTQITANWEQTLYATGYLLNVYKVTGQTPATETEGFDGVGATGTPLPTGWSGTASGNYTTTTSSGTATPSVGLKNNGEWLQTKTYSYPVTKLSYMYRFASTGTGSSLGVYGLSNGVWTRIDSINYSNTTKTTPAYSFSKSQGMTAFKFIYHKSSGNMAIDDVSATYGNQDTVFVRKDAAVSSNAVAVTGLEANIHYYYNVRASLGSSVSPVSETMDVLTTNATAVNSVNNPDLRIISRKDALIISGLKGDEMIRVYNASGACELQRKAAKETMNLQLAGKGVYVLRISNSVYHFTQKLIR